MGNGRRRSRGRGYISTMADSLCIQQKLTQKLKRYALIKAKIKRNGRGEITIDNTKYKKRERDNIMNNCIPINL